MGRLIYSMLTSLDGFVADEAGDFGWAEPDEEVLEAVNEWTAPIGTYLYGRRMYELMTVWETDPAVRGWSAGSATFADIWTAADKIVYSRTRPDVPTSRTKLIREFDPDAIRALKGESDSDIDISGPTLAGEAFRHGLVDEVHLLIQPVLIGAGLPVFRGPRVDLHLVGERRFSSGTVALHYEVDRAGRSAEPAGPH